MAARLQGGHGGLFRFVVQALLTQRLSEPLASHVRKLGCNVESINKAMAAICHQIWKGRHVRFWSRSLKEYDVRVIANRSHDLT